MGLKWIKGSNLKIALFSGLVNDSFIQIVSRLYQRWADGLTIGVSAPRQFGLQGQLGWAGDNNMGNWAAYRDTRAAQFGYDINISLPLLIILRC